VGVVVLALLIGLVYGYWYLTNDRRIRAEAQQYLHELTGAEVRVDRARFSLFGGIRLHGVRLVAPGDAASEPFLQARQVVLRHRPVALLTGGGVQPTSIVCEGAVLRIEHDFRTDTTSTARLMGMSRPQGMHSLAEGMDLPEIRLTDCRLDLVYIEAGPRRVLRSLPVEISMAPFAEGRGYRIRFEEGGPTARGDIRGRIDLDIRTGQMSFGGQFPVRHGVLPAQYSQWLERYKVGGTVELPAQPAPSGAERKVVVRLNDFTLRTPPEEGGLELEKVNGTLEFEEGKVTIRKISGQVKQAGSARFEMAGEYLGYEADAPFRIQLSVWRMELPKAETVAGGLAEAMDRLHRTFAPSGPVNLAVDFGRAEDGKVRFRGVLEPEGMSLQYVDFAYPLKNLRGPISFDSDGQVRPRLTARMGEAKIDIQGEAPFNGAGPMDLSVTVTGGRLEPAVRDALPPEHRSVWDRFRPEGGVDARLRVRQAGPDAPRRLEATMTFGGRAAFRFSGFPYRLSDVSGVVRVEDDTVFIESIRGRKGQAVCRLDGRILHTGTPKEDVLVTVLAHDVPLDDDLAKALAPRSREAFRSAHFTGTVAEARARITQKDLQPLDFTVQITARQTGEVGMKLDAFPYALTGVQGEITIEPERMILKDLTGRHGEAKARVNGALYFLEGQDIGLDLAVRGTDVPVDEELHAALPPGVQRVWRRFRPAGTADIDLMLRQDTPTAPGELYYELAILARGMEATYEEFPYPFRNLHGRIVATPTRVNIEKLQAAGGKSSVLLNGVVELGEKVETTRLQVKAAELPVDEALLAAMPAAVQPLTSRLQPAGTADLDIRKLLLVRPAAAATQPATQPSTRPASRQGWVWEVEGAIGFREAVMDLGAGPKTLTGSISGKGGRTDKGAHLDADVALQSIEVGRERKITDLSGKMRKTAGSAVAVVSDIAGKAHGGRVAGRAEFRLTEPMEYGIALTVDRIDLHDLVNAGVEDPKQRSDARGLLAGTFQMKGATGKNADRQATGQLRISRGKLYKLPVMLGLLNIVSLSLPTDSAFTDGYITYHLRRDTLLFREIHLSGSALSLVGSGRMDMKTEKLDLVFLAGPPGRVPRISALAEELLAGLGRELMEMRVTGTLSKPQTKTVPLRVLDAVIRRLLSPEQEDN